ncbi:hypothetical protein SBRY_10644 [Actinacidiphila bryophytorum]|uniref:Uncharacterized protein n=1 Tax=Actinacidiphila bryophytorum TaxID=1436133 RepID=A0A9W4E6M3_9ACTN|nr:hypothetical protein SBRY_10644 [Actinacidiphila bryophytorum]
MAGLQAGLADQQDHDDQQQQHRRNRECHSGSPPGTQGSCQLPHAYTHPRQRIITFRATAYVGARKHAGAHDQIRPPAGPGLNSTPGAAVLVGGLAARPGGYSEAVVGGSPYCARYDVPLIPAAARANSAVHPRRTAVLRRRAGR